MALHTLLDGVTTNTTGTAVNPQNLESLENGLAVATYSGGTGNALVEGSIDGTTWVTLKTFTGSGNDSVPIYPHMRGQTTSISGATITLKFWEW